MAWCKFLVLIPLVCSLCFENTILNWAITKECLELNNQEGKHKIRKLFLFILKNPLFLLTLNKKEYLWVKRSFPTWACFVREEPHFFTLQISHMIWDTHREFVPRWWSVTLSHWRKLFTSSFSYFDQGLEYVIYGNLFHPNLLFCDCDTIDIKDCIRTEMLEPV